jgi:phage terminase small subunit
MASPGQKPLQNPQWETFSREYSRHGKRERAVVAAGYNAKTWKADGSSSACVQANVLLKNPKVLQRIQYIQENRARKADFTELQLLRELKRIALFDARKLRDPESGDLKAVKEWDADTGAVIAGMEIEKLFQPDAETGRRAHVGYTVKVKTHDKIKAIELLMRYFGMAEALSEKTPTTINDNRQVNYFLPENPRHAKAITDQSHPAAIVESQPDDRIQLPAKRNGSGSH